jgi:hypothetical protein
MRYLAAIAAFVTTYFIAAVAYAELVLQSWSGFCTLARHF